MSLILVNFTVTFSLIDTQSFLRGREYLNKTEAWGHWGQMTRTYLLLSLISELHEMTDVHGDEQVEQGQKTKSASHHDGVIDDVDLPAEGSVHLLIDMKGYSWGRELLPEQLPGFSVQSQLDLVEETKSRG